MIARAVASFPDATAIERADLYAKARQSLLRHLESLEPRLSGSEIAAELWALEEAVERVEAQRQPSTTPVPPSQRRSEPPPAGGQPPRAQSAPEPASQPSPRPAAQPAPARPNSSRSWTPVERAALPAFAASAVFWSALLFGPLADPKFPLTGTVVVIVCYTFALGTLILSLVAAWYRRKRCREAGLVPHRRPVFVRRGTSDDERRRTAAAMDQHDLIWCYALPDHSPQARKIIGEECQRLGYSRDDIDSWVPPATDLTVPCTLERPTRVDRYRSLVRRRMWAFWSYLVVVVILSGLLCTVAVMMTLDGAARQIGLAASIFGFIMLTIAALASLPFRRRALRVLLLRPFGEKRMTRALKHFVRKNAGRVGNVFTLSDRNYKPSLLITLLWRLPAEGFDLVVIFLLGPLLGHSKRIASVKSERKFRKLERHLLRQYSPAFWSFMSGNQAFNIRSSDPWWQLCIHMLMHSCEVIIVDLSKVKEGTAWELGQLHAKNIMGKCIFIVGEDNVADVQPVLEQFFPEGDWPDVHVYSSKGKPADPPAYAARFDEIMSAGIAAWGR